MSDLGSVNLFESIMTSLRKITPQDMEDLSEACNCIQNSSASSGRGLSTGEKIDFFLTKQFLPTNLERDFEEFHEEESDFKILSQPISFKTLRGAGDLAMCWSRNDKTKKETKICRHWQVPLLIYVRESGPWWVTGPKGDWRTKRPFEKSEKLWFRETIGAGFYLINQKCGEGIVFKENNKSTCIVDKQEVYKILIDARENGNFLEMPEPKGKFTEMRFAFFEPDGSEYQG